MAYFYRGRDPIVADGLQMWTTFDGGQVMNMVNGEVASIAGSPARSDSPWGDGMSYGNGHYHRYSINSTLFNYNRGWSCVGWIKPSTYNANGDYGFMCNGNNVVIEMAFTGSWSFRVWTSGGSTTLAMPQLFTNVWQHIVVTNDRVSKRIRGYINGDIAASATHGTSTESSSNANVDVAHTLLSSAQNHYFIGHWGEARMYGRELEPREVRALHADGLARRDARRQRLVWRSAPFAVGQTLRPPLITKLPHVAMVTQS